MTEQPPAQTEARPQPIDVRPEMGSRLALLHAQYPDLKARADEAASLLKSCTDEIKALLGEQIQAVDPTAERGVLRDPEGLAPPMAMTYSSSWRVNTKKLKSQFLEVYVTCAEQSGSWSLRQISTPTGGDD